MNLSVDIGKLVIQNSSAVYRERPAGQSETGRVEFSNLGGVITNITNLPDRIKENPIMHADLETSTMDLGLLTVNRSVEKTSALTLLVRHCYAVFCLKKKKHKTPNVV